MDAGDFLEGNPQSVAAEDFLQSGSSAEEFLAGGEAAAPEGTLAKLYRLGMTPLARLPRRGEPVAEAPGPTEEEIRNMPEKDLINIMTPTIRRELQRQDQAGPTDPVGNAAINTAAGFLEFGTSPVGIATAIAGPVLGVLGKGAGLVGTAARGAGRTIAALYAGDMARQVPEAARQFGEATVGGTTQEKVEKGLQLAANVVLPGGLGRHALRPGERATGLERPRAEVAGVDLGQAGSLEEALAKADEVTKGTEGTKGTQGTQVQTSGQVSPEVISNQGGEVIGGEEAPSVTVLRKESFPTVELPVKGLRLSKDVPNFKADANEATGVVEGQELEGKYERLGTGAITVWERNDGAQQVVSGRHRFDLAKRSGEKTIPAQVIREADGWTKGDVMTLDAEMNIRDGQGSVGDYASYFRHKDMSEEEAGARGLLARSKGQAGWALGKMATDDLYALYRGGKVKEEQAVAIAQAAPGEAALQRVGSKAALKGAGPQELRNFIQAVRFKTQALPAEQLDLFGADDRAMNEAERLAKVATELQRNLDREIRSTDNAARNAAGAAAKGIRFDRDPQEILRENALLRVKRNEWDNWALKPELVAQVLEKAGVGASERGSVERGVDKGDRAGEGVLREEATTTPEISGRELDRGDGGGNDGARGEGSAYAAEVEKLASELRQARAETLSFKIPRRADGRIDWHALTEAQANELFNHERRWIDAKAAAREFISRSGIDYKSSRFPTHDTTALRSAQAELHKLMFSLEKPPGPDRMEQMRRGDELYKQDRERIKAEKAARDKVESILDALKVNTGGPGAMLEGVTGLPVLVWNGSLEAVRLAYRAGKTLVEAAQHGLDWIRANHPGLAFDPEEYLREVSKAFGAPGGPADAAEAMAGRRRQFPKKVDVSPDVSQAVKQALPAGARFYDVRSNESDADWARRKIDEGGVPGAITALKDETNGLPGAQRTALGIALIKRLGLEERAADGKGDTQGKQAAIDAQVDLVDHMARRATDIAQSLQAMSMWARMTPAGHLARAQRIFRDAGERAIKGLRPVLDEVRGILERGNAEAAGEVQQAPEVRAAAESAVRATIVHSPETHTAVIVNVAGKMGESPEVLRQIRERVRGLVAADERAAMEMRLRNLLGEHFKGVSNQLGKVISNQRPLVEKLKEAGLKESDAAAVASTAERVFKGKVVEGKERVRKAVSRGDAEGAEGKRLGLLAGDAEIDAAVRGQLRKLGVRLDTIVKWHFTRGDETGASLSKRLAEGLGLSEDGANFLAGKIEARFRALASERKRAMLARLPALARARVTARPGLQQRLIELSNVGAFSEEQFYNGVKEKLGLPVWSPEVAREITRMANRAQEAPEGFQQQRGMVGLMNFIEKQKGMRWQDLALPFWFANILSGPTTHLVNMVSNTFNLGAHVGLEIGKRPAATLGILSAIGRGVVKGGIEAADVMRTGVVTGTRSAKLEAGRALELKKFTGWATPLNAWKYVYRAMAAEDLLFFKSAEEMRMAVAARVIAKKEGLSGAELARRTEEVLGNTDEVRTRAELQATREGLKGMDFRRRVGEIVEQSRPASLREDARQYGLKVTFNNEPYGALGVIAQGFNQMSAKLPAMRLIVPFVNIVANVANESLSYLPPVGLYRALRGSWSGELDGRPITNPDQVTDQYAKAALGLAALAGLAALHVQHQDEPRPRFAISGAGPGTQDQKRQLQETGWVPYSFKIGERYYSYAQTPLAIPMAILGNYLDAERFKHLDETDAMNRVAYAFGVGGRVITEQSFLQGISDVFEAVNRDSTKRAGELAVNRVMKTAAGFVVPNVLKQVDQMFDPTVYDARTVAAAVVNQVPFARRSGQPAINVLGEPVQRYGSSRFLSDARGDELWNLLAEKQAWVPVPNKETIVGDKKRGEDYFRVLSPAELYEYTKESGQAIQDRLLANIDRLYAAEPAKAKELVNRITEQEREKVKRRMK